MERRSEERLSPLVAWRCWYNLPQRAVGGWVVTAAAAQSPMEYLRLGLVHHLFCLCYGVFVAPAMKQC